MWQSDFSLSTQLNEEKKHTPTKIVRIAHTKRSQSQVKRVFIDELTAQKEFQIDDSSVRFITSTFSLLN